MDRAQRLKGAPRPLGASAPSAPLVADSGPTQGTGQRPDRRRGDDTAFTEGGGAPLDLNAAARGGAAAPSAPVSGLNPATVAGLNPAATAGSGDGFRAEYDAAYAYFTQKQYEQAEAGFRRFVAAHPRDRLAADATYWLGESYVQRGKHKEAAEQFLKVSTEHTRSGKGPEALLKLGMSLSALGAKDQACATFAEVERKYPNAAASVKQGVDREQKRARCAG